MTNEQILNKAIEKAIKGGYKAWGKPENRLVWNKKTESYWIEWDSEDGEGYDYVAQTPFCPKVNVLIFSHDFAKAFWGDRTDYVTDEGTKHIVGYPYYDWQFHLQQMVLEENPLEYLAKFI